MSGLATSPHFAWRWGFRESSEIVGPERRKSIAQRLGRIGINPSSGGPLGARAAGVVMWPTAVAVGDGPSTMSTFSPFRGGIRSPDLAGGAILGPMSPLPGLKRYGEISPPTARAVGHRIPPLRGFHDHQCSRGTVLYAPEGKACAGADGAGAGANCRQTSSTASAASSGACQL